MIHAPQSSPPPREYPRYERGQRVALFVPCYMDQFYPQVGQATARLLTRLGQLIRQPSLAHTLGLTLGHELLDL